LSNEHSSTIVARPQQRLRGLTADAITVAKRLLGQRLVRVLPGCQRLSGIIVEVEAYLGAEDRAAHTFGGRRTPRNESMYLPGGHVYVYFTYGMHYCLNVVCGRRDQGTAVLIRAIEPSEGIDRMLANREGVRTVGDLCSGPARLTKAMAIDRSFDGENLMISQRLFIEQVRRSPPSPREINTTPRIGLNPDPRHAGEWAFTPLRYILRDNPFVSRARWSSQPKASKHRT
jgi:DNA-3-methyladenine glycosylase